MYNITTVILLQTVKVGRGIHLVKNLESQSRTHANELFLCASNTARGGNKITVYTNVTTVQFIV